MHNNEQMTKPEQDSKVENPHLLLPSNKKKTNKTQNLHNILQLNTMEENIIVIKTTMGVLAKGQISESANRNKQLTVNAQV